MSQIVNGNQNQGTEYRTTVNFKVGYSYKITINAARIMSQQAGANVLLRLDLNNEGSGNNIQCNGTGIIDANSSGDLRQSLQITSASFSDYIFDYTSLSAAESYLMIAAIPPAGSVYQTILIRKITIVETAPAPAFTITSSSSSISCGSTTPITFTATGSNIPSGAALSYSWNLGATPNGWLYNGNPAPQTISTGTTNTLTLTPVCGATQSSVSATATVNSTNYNTNTSTVSVTAPSLTIQGSTSFCSGTSVYSLVGTIPCNATVTWTATPAGILSLTPNGSSVTVTQVGDGIATLTATINACNNYAVSQPIAVGVPDRPKVLDEMGNEVTSVSACTNSYISLCPIIDSKWGVLEWEWEKVAGNFNLLDYGSCADIIGFEPSSGFISVRVRNACGWSNPTFIVVSITECGSITMQQSSIKLFPNPATSSVTISVDNTRQNQLNIERKDNAQLVTINDVKVYDNFGRVRFYKKFIRQQTATLNIAGLPTGIYMVEVNTGNRLAYQPLIIQR